MRHGQLPTLSDKISRVAKQWLNSQAIIPNHRMSVSAQTVSWPNWKNDSLVVSGVNPPLNQICHFVLHISNLKTLDEKNTKILQEELEKYLHQQFSYEFISNIDELHKFLI